MATKAATIPKAADGLAVAFVAKIRDFTTFARASATKSREGDFRFTGFGQSLRRKWDALGAGAGEVQRWIMANGLPSLPKTERGRARGSDELPSALLELSELVSSAYMTRVIEDRATAEVWASDPTMKRILESEFRALMKPGHSDDRIVIASHRLDELDRVASAIGQRFLGEIPQTLAADPPMPPKPGGYTKAELIREVVDRGVALGATKFNDIRDRAGVKPRARGGKGAHQTFSNVEIRKLAKAAEAGTFRNGRKIAAALRDLIAPRDTGTKSNPET